MLLPTGGARLPTRGARLPTRGARLPTRGARLPTRGARLPTSGVLLPTSGARLPTRGARLPTRGSNEDGRRYAPTNEGCASTTDLLRCEVSSDHSDHVVAQKAGCRSILALGMTTRALGMTPATILRYIG